MLILKIKVLEKARKGCPRLGYGRGWYIG